MTSSKYTISETAWCPGCGDHNILSALADALTTLNIEPHKVLVAAGIGQAAKTPQYINTNAFCGLHGRAIPPAVGAKIANKDLTVIINSGDGDTYGEGGNHFMHNIRKNVDITHFVHNNQIYGLTKGQASPTTAAGHITNVQTNGNITEPLNPILLALSLGVGFVARAFSGDKEYLTKIMIEAIKYNGYALVDILQPCVTYNKINTSQWYKNKSYKLDEDYDYTDKGKAFEKAMEWEDKIPLGIIYKVEKPTFHDKVSFLKEGPPLVESPVELDRIKGFMEDFR